MENVELLRATTQIVTAWTTKNSASPDELATVISNVYKSLQSASDVAAETKAEDRPTPAVPVKKSVHPDYIVCLEDGKKLKMLKRHLRTTYNMTPDEYRAKWGLAPDYPMVAPNYAAQRSDFAKKIGLGRARKTRSRKAA